MRIHPCLPRRRAALGALAAAATLVAGCAAWPPGGVTVTGRDNPSLDLPAVQQALDQGGLVRLKGVFDFGEKGSVRITRDVTIIGEADATGRPTTVVKGGYESLRAPRPETISAPGPRITIRQIHFDGASWMPVHLMYTSGATFARNLVTNVKPLAFPPNRPISGDKPYNMQQGVMIGGPTFGPEKAAPYLPGAVTGPISIVDNEFDLAGPAPTTTVAQAVFVAFTTGIEADIARNRIRNVARNAVETIDNYRGADGRGRIVVRDNDIETPTTGTPMPTPRTPNGIAVGYFLDPTAAADEKRAIPHEVVGNRIRLRGQTAPSAGIALLLNRASAEGNHITLLAPSAVGVSVSGSSNRVMRNRIEGNGLIGIVVAPGGPFKGSANEVTDNDLAQLKASGGEVSLLKGSSQNRVAGSSGTVNDAGEGNVTSGLKTAAK